MACVTEPHADPRVGLCSLCAHARVVRSGKGSTFWLCDRARLEPTLYRKYPPVPVRSCPGYEESGA